MGLDKLDGLGEACKAARMKAIRKRADFLDGGTVWRPESLVWAEQ